MNPESTITGVVLTRNGERLLDRCLHSLSFCDKILVVDSFSTDRTQEIAEEYGADFVRNEWSGPVAQYTFAFGRVDTDWIVVLDQDEICSDALREQISLGIGKAPAKVCGFFVRRKTWYFDRFMKHGGWYPDRLFRVFRKGGVTMTQSGAHEELLPVGKARSLKGEVLHYTYESFLHQVRKNNDYAEQGAMDLREQGRRGGVAAAVGHGLWRFVRMYVLRLGLLDGRAGFVLACHDAFYAFSKYLRVEEASWGKPYDHR